MLLMENKKMLKQDNHEENNIMSDFWNIFATSEKEQIYGVDNHIYSVKKHKFIV